MAIEDKKTLFDEVIKSMKLCGHIEHDCEVRGDSNIACICDAIEKKIAESKDEVIQALKRDIPPL